MKAAVTLSLQYGKENCVVMPDSWKKNVSAARTWLKGLRKCHESLCSRKTEATNLNRSTSFNHENVKVFLENLKELETQIHS